MKKTYLALAVAAVVASPLALAQDYQIEGRLGYATGEAWVEDVDVISVGGTFHFETVSTENRPLAEAAFLGHNSNVSLNYAQSEYDDGFVDAEVSALGVSGQVWVDQLYLEAGFTSLGKDGDGEDYNIGVGFMLEPNLLVKAVYVDGDSYEKSVFGIGAKTVRDLSGEQSLNLEGALLTSDGEQALSVGGDFYPDRKLGVGAGLTFYTESGVDTAFEVRARYFFTPAFSVKAAYQDSGDSGDLIGLEAALRF